VIGRWIPSAIHLPLVAVDGTRVAYVAGVAGKTTAAVPSGPGACLPAALIIVYPIMVD
jgi:hypothetical protein